VVLCVYLPSPDKLLQLEIEDGDKIDFFTEQLGGGDNIQHTNDEALEQMDMYQKIQAPCGVAQDQNTCVENAQRLAYSVNQPGNQMAACPSARNAEFAGESRDRNEQEDRNTTQEQVGLTQNVPANEISPATLQTSQTPLSIGVTDESGSNQLIVKMKPSTPMRKLMMNVCARWGTPLDVSCFLLDGCRISPNDTPASVCILSSSSGEDAMTYKID
jgi:hypothetical protein